MSCRTGCKTKDHASYAECLRASRASMSATINSPLQWMFDKTKQDLPAYEAAKAQGISPTSTSYQAVQEAKQASDLLGRPYDATTDPPAHMIENKTAAKFVNWKE